MERFKNQTINKHKIEGLDDNGASRHNGGLIPIKRRSLRSPESRLRCSQKSSVSLGLEN
ncbi:hypothetical protein Hanom_Chr09g00805911 [Helianthus anomalus]